LYYDFLSNLCDLSGELLQNSLNCNDFTRTPFDIFEGITLFDFADILRTMYWANLSQILEQMVFIKAVQPAQQGGDPPEPGSGLEYFPNPGMRTTGNDRQVFILFDYQRLFEIIKLSGRINIFVNLETFFYLYHFLGYFYQVFQSGRKIPKRIAGFYARLRYRIKW
jgi:hypothetical protein